MKTWILLIVVSCFATGGWARPASPKTQREILVTDEAGTPVANATVALAISPYGQSLPWGANEQRVSDLNGRCSLPAAEGDWYHCRIKDVHCPGYVFETYLNPVLSLPLNMPVNKEGGQPFRCVLRRQGDERYAPYRADVNQLLIVGGKWQTDGNPWLDVNLLPVQWSTDSASAHYVDFTVTPHLESDWRRCYVDFSVPASHAGCGVLATTNRVYVAPESGYAPRVRVSPEVYAHEQFTLYLRTRNPGLYIMVVPDPLCHEWTIGEDGKATFRFLLQSVAINLTGSRSLEPDLQQAELGVVGVSDLNAFLEKGTYVIGEDVAKRIERLKMRESLEREKVRLTREQKLVGRNLAEMEMRSKQTGEFFPERMLFQERNGAIDARLKAIDLEIGKLHQ